MYLVYGGFFQQIRERYFRRLLSYYCSQPGSRLLDFGCGPGDVLLLARELGIEAHGVDNSERSVSLAQERGLSVKLNGSGAISTEMGEFSAILLQSVIEHVPNPIDLLRDLIQSLRPGGYLIVSAPTPASSFWDDPTHIRPFTPRSYDILGELCGVETVHVSYVFAFLLGIRLRAAWIYKLMNLISVPLGSNVIAVYRKPSL
jgi:2-polyprenyl-3-methyl-5-hydroxy-6-metoxy-1,4-benzoquinol methylase